MEQSVRIGNALRFRQRTAGFVGFAILYLSSFLAQSSEKSHILEELAGIERRIAWGNAEIERQSQKAKSLAQQISDAGFAEERLKKDPGNFERLFEATRKKHELITALSHTEWDLRSLRSKLDRLIDDKKKAEAKERFYSGRQGAVAEAKMRAEFETEYEALTTTLMSKDPNQDEQSVAWRKFCLRWHLEELDSAPVPLEWQEG